VEEGWGKCKGGGGYDLLHLNSAVGLTVQEYEWVYGSDTEQDRVRRNDKEKKEYE
jgi:hypothetical protein